MGNKFILDDSGLTVVVLGPFGHGLVAGAPAAAPRAVRRRGGHRGLSLSIRTPKEAKATK